MAHAPFPAPATHARTHAPHRIWLVILACGLLLNCFDYRERIVFKRDLGGVLEIAYTVPVHGESGNSALAFLPTEYDRIVSRYSSFLFLDKVDLRDFRLRYSLGPSVRYPLLAHVSYKIDFKRPAELERYLLGRSSVVLRRGQVVIRRLFPVSRPLPENASRLPRRILTMVRENLERRAMEFRVEAPAGFDLSSNQGQTRGNALVFQLPLEDTLSNKQDFNWRIGLTKR